MAQHLRVASRYQRAFLTLNRKDKVFLNEKQDYYENITIRDFHILSCIYTYIYFVPFLFVEIGT